MKKMIALMMVLACVTGLASSAGAETGFMNLYELYSDEQVFGEPWQVYDMAEESETEKICFAIFLFDPENDVAQTILIGADEEGLNKYYLWVTDYEAGATVMGLLINKFAELKAACDKDVDFCVSYSFDGGETMTDIDTEDAAEELDRILTQDAEDRKLDEATVKAP